MFASLLSVMMLVSTGLADESEYPIERKEQTPNEDVVQDQNCDLDNSVLLLQEQIFRMTEKMDKLERKVNREVTRPTLPTPAGNAQQYAFSARLSNTVTLYHGRLAFRQIITNVGGAYNTNTGVFTAAVDGLYVFYFHGQASRADTHCVLSLFHNHKNVANTFSYAHNGNPSFANAAVLALKKGETVHLQVTSPFARSECFLRGPFSTFSGFKL